MKGMKPYLFTLPLIAALTWACGGGGGGGEPQNLTAQTITANAAFPTALRVLANGDIYFTEKSSGNVRKIVAGNLLPTPVLNVAVNADGERGLLGLAIDANHSVNGFVYIFYTKANGTENEVLRFTDVNNIGQNAIPIVTGLVANDTHNGGKLEFGPDGKLYVTTGDAGDPANSQNDATTAGKILRYNSNGTIPADNPVPGNPLYTKGHRNCFGLAIASNGVVFVSENGPGCDDEVNRLILGENYGWRSGQPCGDSDPSFAAPLYRLPTVVAPTGIAIGSGSYANTLLMASFNDRKLKRITLNGFPNGSLSSVATLYTSPSEVIIDVSMGPDGNPYIATANFGGGGSILRLVP